MPNAGMRAGQLRHRLRIEQVSETADGTGQPVETWSQVATVWGAVEPLQGNEIANARQLHAEVTHRIVIRYLAGLTPKHRLVFLHRGTERIFDVLSVLNWEERNVRLEIMAKERLSNAACG